MPGVSIVDTRNIIRAIRKKYRYDFSNYALTQFRYRIDDVIARYNLTYTDILINRLVEDEKFFDEFLYDISVPQTEIFRDPEMWIRLRERVIPLLEDMSSVINVWFPDCTDTNDIASLYEILGEARMVKKIRILASCLSLRMISELKSGKGTHNNHQPI